jgi:hypothetical protein
MIGRVMTICSWGSSAEGARRRGPDNRRQFTAQTPRNKHREDDYYEQLTDYVHLNPVRAGMIAEGEGFDSMERTSVPQKWIVEELAMGSAPYLSRPAKDMGQRVARGDRAMKRLKKAIVARVVT